MENLILAATNLYGFRAVIGNKNFYQRTSICLAMFASIIYHSVENIKHDLTGLYPFDSYKNRVFYNLLWLNADRICAVIAAVTNFKLRPIMNNCDNIIQYGTLSVVCNILSEFGKFFPHPLNLILTNNLVYLGLHSAWHIGIFHCGYILSKYD